MLLEGIFAALTTPFYPDGRVYTLKLEQNLERYSRTPIAGMVVLGSTGEVVLLREQEQVHVLETAIRSVAADKVMIAGIGQESLVATLVMAEHAARLNYDAVLVRTPHYYRSQMRAAEMLHYYRAVADASPLPVLLYSVPACTAYELPVEIAAELAKHPNIVGMKDSSNSPDRIAKLVTATAAIKRSVTVTPTFAAVTERMVLAAVREASANLVQLEPFSGTDTGAGSTAVATPVASTIKTRTRTVGFQVLAGSASTLHGSLQAGATGAVLALAAAAPQACYEVFAAHSERNPSLADEKQQRIFPAAQRIAAQMGIPAIKYAAELNGYFGGYPRVPLLPLTYSEKEEVANLMQDIRA
jgi:dihydrodipicolinate synthase/N-acetylneuraminate lyase